MKKYRGTLSFFRINKYQKNIVAIPFISNFVLIALITIFLIFYHGKIITIIATETTPENIDIINKGIISVIFLLWIFFSLVMVWAFSASSNLVGAFVRIMNELDEVIDQRKKKRIYARGSDELANDLLKRINQIIEYIS